MNSQEKLNYKDDIKYLINYGIENKKSQLFIILSNIINKKIDLIINLNLQFIFNSKVEEQLLWSVVRAVEGTGLENQ